MVSSSVGLCNLETGWNKNNVFTAIIWKYKPFPLKATFNGYLISVSGTKVSRTILTCATVWNVPKRCWTRTASSSGDSSKISSRPPTSTSQAINTSHLFDCSCPQDCWWCQMSAVQQVKRSSAKRIQTLSFSGGNSYTWNNIHHHHHHLALFN